MSSQAQTPATESPATQAATEPAQEAEESNSFLNAILDFVGLGGDDTQATTSEGGGGGSGAADSAAAPEEAPAPLFEVTDDNSLVRDPSNYKSTGEVIPLGTLVHVHDSYDRFVHFSTEAGASFQKSQGDNCWTASSNLAAEPTAIEVDEEVVEAPGEMAPIAEAEDPSLFDQAWDLAISIGDEVASWFEDSEEEAGGEEVVEVAAGEVIEEEEDPEESKTPTVPPGDIKYGRSFVVVDNAAYIRDQNYKRKDPPSSLTPGATLYVVDIKQRGTTNYIQVITAEGSEGPAITAADNTWTNIGNIGSLGADVGLGNEATDEADAAKAAEISEGLPPDRNPGQSPYQWQLGGGFASSLDGVTLSGSLFNKVTRMLDWAIHNDMVAGNIVVGSGMRSPATAHRMCTAWNIQYGPDDRKNTTIARAKELSGGKDADGNTWYQPGWSDAEIISNANSVRSSTAIAAAGYASGNKRLPLPDGRPGVSRHCSGGAIDVTIPWRKDGKSATTNESDVWGGDEIYAMFGLHRPLPKGHKYEENWHVEETGKQLNIDEGAAPEPEMN